ncbi:MAG: FkbM family methyltransferase [Vicinamibacterales bacterium]
MRILFVIKQMGYMRHFTSVVATLAARGHGVRIAAQDGVLELPEALQDQPLVSATTCDSKRHDEWRDYVSLLRRSGDYLRYLTPPFAGARKLRARAFDKLARTVSHGSREPVPGVAELGLGLTPAEIERLQDTIRRLGNAIPADRGIQKWIQSEAPDLVLISPLVDIGSSQADYVKACRELDIPIALLLFSWDNLSTKGLMHEVPDRLLLWNELQAREAVDLHGVPRDRIAVTGAPRFDDFFRLRPSLSRAEYDRLFGFDPSAPTITYLASSKFIAEEHEDRFIAGWIDAVRRTPGLERANILVKAHPDLNRAWGDEGERLAWKARHGEVRVRVTRPFDAERAVVVRTTFSGAQFLYECLHHAEAAVGLNTSAELEAAIVGRPVLTITAPDELADGQSGTLHFHYLLREHGGFVQASPDLATHCAALAAAVRGEVDVEAQRDFVRSFIRPHGLNVRATKVAVHEIEQTLKLAERQRARDARRAAARAAAERPAAEAAPPAGETTAGDTVMLDYEAVPVQIRVTSPEERNWRARPCAKEPWTVDWIERIVRPDTVLYDIGANVGAFSLIAAKREPLATVVAVEPGYATFAHLCDNIVLNGCQQRIVPVQLPLWSTTGLAAFKYRNLSPGQSRHAMRALESRESLSRSQGKYEQPVLGTRLDDLIGAYRLPPPTAIKLDVDGAELEVLRGAAHTLAAPSLTALLVELDRELENEATGLLQRAGFTLVDRVDRDKSDAPVYAEFRRGD